MALFKGKYQVKTFTEISSSDDFSASRDFKTTQKIPYSLQLGSKSDWFDVTKIEADKIVKLENKYFYIPIKKSNFVDMMDTYLTSNINPSAYTTISASFFKKFNSYGDNDYITITEEDGIPPTASYSMSPRSGISPHTLTITNTSIYTTGATWSFSPGSSTHEIHQSNFTSSMSHLLTLSASLSQSIHLSGPYSGSVKGIINTSTYPGIGTSFLKMQALGDGEEDDGNIHYFSPIQEILTYPQGTTINSASYRYNQYAQSTPTSAIISVYYSGSLNTGSNNVSSGSHIYLSANLAVTASSGWYLVNGTSVAHEVPDISIKYATKRFNGNTSNV